MEESRRKLTQQELDNILTEHELWLKGKGGKQADLSNTDLSDMDLSGRNLTGANLYNANLFDFDPETNDSEFAFNEPEPEFDGSYMIYNDNGQAVNVNDETLETIEIIKEADLKCGDKSLKATRDYINKLETKEEMNAFEREIGKLEVHGAGGDITARLGDIWNRISSEMNDARTAHGTRSEILKELKIANTTYVNKGFYNWNIMLRKVDAIFKKGKAKDSIEGKDERERLNRIMQKGQTVGKHIGNTFGAVGDLLNIADRPEVIVNLAGRGAKATAELAVFIIKLAAAAKNNSIRQFGNISEKLRLIDPSIIEDIKLPEERDLPIIKNSNAAINIGEDYWLQGGSCTHNIEQEKKFNLDSQINRKIDKTEEKAVRPVLHFKEEDAQAFGLSVGEKFQFGSLKFKMISKDMAVCTASAGKCAFEKDGDKNYIGKYLGDLKKELTKENKELELSRKVQEIKTPAKAHSHNRDDMSR